MRYHAVAEVVVIERRGRGEWMADAIGLVGMLALAAAVVMRRNPLLDVLDEVRATAPCLCAVHDWCPRHGPYGK